MESLGAKFVDFGLETKDAEAKTGYAKAQSEDFYQHQRQLMARAVAAADVVITTALVPGKRAPVLITEEMVQGMRPGSVIVDLAAEQGGNCALTEPGQEVVTPRRRHCRPHQPAEHGALLTPARCMPARSPTTCCTCSKEAA